jgi:hypothetical protein
MRAELLPKAKLAQVLKNDVSSPDVLIGGLDGAVFASTEAVIVQILLVAVGALPKDVARLKVHLAAQLLFNLSEILQEVDCAVRRACEPEINVDDIVLRHDKFAHYHELF